MPLFELDEGPSRKFYRIELANLRIELHWGAFESKGQKRSLTFEYPSEAEREFKRLVAERRDHGYREVVDESAPRDIEAAVNAQLAGPVPLSKSPRFHFIHLKKKRFVWLECRGTTLLRAEGVQGKEAAAEPRLEEHGTAASAVLMRDAEIRRLMGDGWELRGVAAKPQLERRPKSKTLQVNERLENSIAEKPSDESRWLVLEDWLLEVNDPRAELIRLEKARSRADAAVARGACLPLLLGQHSKRITRALSAPTWRSGFLQECIFSVSTASEVAAFEGFMTAPGASLMTTLGVRMRPTFFAACVPAFAKAHFARSLRVLDVRAADRVELAPNAFEGFSRLESLCVGLAQMPSWSTLEQLRRLTLEVRAPKDVEVLGEAAWPHLVALEIAGVPSAMMPLLLNDRFPALKELVVADGFHHQADWLKALAASELLKRLHTVVLGDRRVDPKVMRKTHGRAFEHLEALAL